MVKRLNNAKRQTNYLVCNIEGSGTFVPRHLCAPKCGGDMKETGTVIMID